MFRSIIFLLTAATSFAAPRNVLLICVDDLKPILGCYGDKFAKTPNLDALAARGMKFERAYCNQAVCSPSRNALMVGVRPQTLGIYELATNFRKAMPDATTLGQVFQKNGYRAEAMGKIYHQGQGNADDALTWSVPHWNPKAKIYNVNGNQPNLSAEEAKLPANKQPRGPAFESADVADDSYGDGCTAAEACKRLEAAQKQPDQPFFMGVGFTRPHLPFCSPKKYWDLYDPAVFELAEVTSAPDAAPSFACHTFGELRSYSGVPPTGPLAAPYQRSLIHGYYAATSYMDAQLGKILKTLKDTGLEKNTLVVLWGDHGWHLGDHGMWCKHSNYEQATRIPVIIAGPDVKQGVAKTFIETVDIFPTLLAWAGVQQTQTNQPLDGKSFAPVLENPTAEHRQSVIHVYPRENLLGRSIRNDRYRLVEWKAPGAALESAVYELYDYQADPLERRNQADVLKPQLEEMKKILAQHPEAKPAYKAMLKPLNEDPSALATRKSAFLKRDKNKDGKLDLPEFLDNQPDPDQAPKRFPLFDKDKDGVLSEVEYVKGGK